MIKSLSSSRSHRKIEEDNIDYNDKIVKNYDKNLYNKTYELIVSNANIQDTVNKEDNALITLKKKAVLSIEQGKIIEGLNYYETSTHYWLHIDNIKLNNSTKIKFTVE